MYLDKEETQRLDKKLNEKFDRYHELMAQHRIDETPSEMNSSIIS